VRCLAPLANVVPLWRCAPILNKASKPLVSQGDRYHISESLQSFSPSPASGCRCRLKEVPELKSHSAATGACNAPQPWGRGRFPGTNGEVQIRDVDLDALGCSFLLTVSFPLPCCRSVFRKNARGLCTSISDLLSLPYTKKLVSDMGLSELAYLRRTLRPGGRWIFV
jgi:hypothetical protein